MFINLEDDSPVQIEICQVVMMRKTSICVYTVFCIFVLGVCIIYVGKKLINIFKKKVCNVAV